MIEEEEKKSNRSALSANAQARIDRANRLVRQSMGVGEATNEFIQRNQLSTVPRATVDWQKQDRIGNQGMQMEAYRPNALEVIQNGTVAENGQFLFKQKGVRKEGLKVNLPSATISIQNKSEFNGEKVPYQLAYIPQYTINQQIIQQLPASERKGIALLNTAVATSVAAELYEISQLSLKLYQAFISLAKSGFFETYPIFCISLKSGSIYAGVKLIDGQGDPSWVKKQLSNKIVLSSDKVAQLTQQNYQNEFDQLQNVNTIQYTPQWKLELVGKKTKGRILRKIMQLWVPETDFQAAGNTTNIKHIAQKKGIELIANWNKILRAQNSILKKAKNRNKQPAVKTDQEKKVQYVINTVKKITAQTGAIFTSELAIWRVFVLEIQKKIQEKRGIAQQNINNGMTQGQIMQIKQAQKWMETWGNVMLDPNVINYDVIPVSKPQFKAIQTTEFVSQLGPKQIDMGRQIEAGSYWKTPLYQDSLNKKALGYSTNVEDRKAQQQLESFRNMGIAMKSLGQQYKQPIMRILQKYQLDYPSAAAFSMADQQNLNMGISGKVYIACLYDTLVRRGNNDYQKFAKCCQLLCKLQRPDDLDVFSRIFIRLVNNAFQGKSKKDLIAWIFQNPIGPEQITVNEQTGEQSDTILGGLLTVKSLVAPVDEINVLLFHCLALKVNLKATRTQGQYFNLSYDDIDVSNNIESLLKEQAHYGMRLEYISPRMAGGQFLDVRQDILNQQQNLIIEGGQYRSIRDLYYINGFFDKIHNLDVMARTALLTNRNDVLLNYDQFLDEQLSKWRPKETKWTISGQDKKGDFEAAMQAFMKDLKEIGIAINVANQQSNINVNYDQVRRLLAPSIADVRKIDKYKQSGIGKDDEQDLGDIPDFPAGQLMGQV